MKTSSYVRSYGGWMSLRKRTCCTSQSIRGGPRTGQPGGRARTSFSHGDLNVMPAQIIQAGQGAVGRILQGRGRPTAWRRAPGSARRPTPAPPGRSPTRRGGPWRSAASPGPQSGSPRQSARASQFRPNHSGRSRARTQRSMKPALSETPLRSSTLTCHPTARAARNTSANGPSVISAPP